MTVRELLNDIVESGSGMEDLVRINFQGKSLPLHCDRAMNCSFHSIDDSDLDEYGDEVDGLRVLTFYAYERGAVEWQANHNSN